MGDMCNSDVSFERENIDLGVEVINEEEQELDLAQDEDDKLNTLADLIVENLRIIFLFHAFSPLSRTVTIFFRYRLSENQVPPRFLLPDSVSSVSKASGFLR